MNITVTVVDIMAKKLCSDWTEERIAKHIGDGKTLIEILAMNDVEEKYRIWCVIQFLPDKINRTFAIWCARQCTPTLPEITPYIDIIEKYYAGNATQDELYAARNAVDNAICSAAYSAPDWVAYNAALCAAYIAAYSAAYSAADWADMRQRQINKLTELIKEGESK